MKQTHNPRGLDRPGVDIGRKVHPSNLGLIFTGKVERKEGFAQTIWLRWLHKNMWKMDKDSGIVCM